MSGSWPSPAGAWGTCSPSCPVPSCAVDPRGPRCSPTSTYCSPVRVRVSPLPESPANRGVLLVLAPAQVRPRPPRGRRARWLPLDPRGSAVDVVSMLDLVRSSRRRPAGGDACGRFPPHRCVGGLLGRHPRLSTDRFCESGRCRIRSPTGPRPRGKSSATGDWSGGHTHRKPAAPAGSNVESSTIIGGHALHPARVGESFC
jgi:hypothetical protein